MLVEREQVGSDRSDGSGGSDYIVKEVGLGVRIIHNQSPRADREDTPHALADFQGIDTPLVWNLGVVMPHQDGAAARSVVL